MSKQEDDDQQRFDAVLRRLLTTPPQPRSERKLGKQKPGQKTVSRAIDEKRDTSA